MSSIQPHCCLKVDFQKVDEHTGGKWLIHDTKCHKNNQFQSLKSPVEYPNWVSRCDIKGSDGTMLSPIFWKKAQGHKHPGRWEIAKRKIPSVKMLFETNTNDPKHPCISLFIIEQDTIEESKDNSKWHSTQEPCTPQKTYRLWWGAASPILKDTPCVCIYASYNQNS